VVKLAEAPHGLRERMIDCGERFALGILHGEAEKRQGFLLRQK
jgi:hypothetical protein